MLMKIDIKEPIEKDHAEIKDENTASIENFIKLYKKHFRKEVKLRI